MSALLLFSILFTFAVAGNADGINRVAVAALTPRPIPSANIYGTVIFTETNDGLHITGTIVGLPAGKYGFHVHESGDISTCDTAGGHFNPDNTNHGGINHAERHVGDLGNIEFVTSGANGIANLNFTDHLLTLRGSNSILGRTLVLHEGEDDLGLGDNEASLINGNAGPRVACGVIGISYPSDPWNAAAITSPSILMFIVTMYVLFISLA